MYCCLCLKSILLVNYYFFFFFCSQPEEEVNYFSQSCILRESLATSVVEPDAPLKNRVTLLELAVENQMQRDDVTFDNIVALSKDSSRIDAALNISINTKTSDIAEDLKRFKEEVHHRFELQSAENKRLQASIASLKAENHLLTKDLVRSITVIITTLSACFFS
jgi:hypothetical protein